jgi:hypothetical protein
MSFGFLVAGFLATTNAGRVALAARAGRPSRRSVALALLLGFGLAAVTVVFAGDLLDGLAISPESFRIAAGMVLAATGLRSIVWPQPAPGPFAAVLVTPELVVLGISFGADESTVRALGAAAISIPIVAWAALSPWRQPAALAAQFLAALQVVVAVALGVSGIRDV